MSAGRLVDTVLIARKINHAGGMTGLPAMDSATPNAKVLTTPHWGPAIPRSQKATL